MPAKLYRGINSFMDPAHMPPWSPMLLLSQPHASSSLAQARAHIHFETAEEKEAVDYDSIHKLMQTVGLTRCVSDVGANQPAAEPHFKQKELEPQRMESCSADHQLKKKLRGYFSLFA